MCVVIFHSIRNIAMSMPRSMIFLMLKLYIVIRPCINIFIRCIRGGPYSTYGSLRLGRQIWMIGKSGVINHPFIFFPLIKNHEINQSRIFYEIDKDIMKYILKFIECILWYRIRRVWKSFNTYFFHRQLSK